MADTDTQDWVPAAAVTRETGVPIEVIYRLADQRAIPFQDRSTPWSKRRRYLFTVASVRAAIAEMEKARRVS